MRFSQLETVMQSGPMLECRAEGRIMSVQLRRWTRQEYERMIDAGVLTTEDRVELVDGEIVTVTPQKSRHATAVRLAETALRRAFGEGVDVRTQLPLALDPASEPEPDVAVVTGAPRDYRDAHPSTALLIVEVADTSLDFDRTKKAAVYARAGIPDYWIVNLVDEVIEVYREPQQSGDASSAGRYAAVSRHRTPDRIAPLSRPDRSIAVEDLVP
jgi:Uma2 family endonuclease